MDSEMVHLSTVWQPSLFDHLWAHNKAPLDSSTVVSFGTVNTSTVACFLRKR